MGKMTLGVVLVTSALLSSVAMAGEKDGQYVISNKPKTVFICKGNIDTAMLHLSVPNADAVLEMIADKPTGVFDVAVAHDYMLQMKRAKLFSCAQVAGVLQTLLNTK